MGMGGGYKDAVGGNSGPLARKGLGFVQHRTRHHAAVDHHDGDLDFAVGQNNGLGEDGVGHPGGAATGHAAVDQHGELLGAYVDGNGSRAKLGSGEMCETERKDEE